MKWLILTLIALFFISSVSAINLSNTIEFKNGEYNYSGVKIIPNMTLKTGTQLKLDTYFESKITKVNESYDYIDSYKFGLINKTAIPALTANNFDKFSYTISGDNLVQSGDKLLFISETNNKCGAKEFACNDVYQYDFRDLVSKTKTKSYNITMIGNSYKLDFFGFENYDFDPIVNFTQEVVYSVSVAPMSNDTFVVCWDDQAAKDVECSKYNISGVRIGEQMTVDNDVGGSGDPDYNSVSVTPLNRTDFVVAYFDYTDSDISYVVYNPNGAKTAIIDVNQTVGASNAVSVAAFNQTTFVIGFYDQVEYDYSYRVCDISGLCGNQTDVNNNVGTTSYAVSVSALNLTSFVISYFDAIQRDITYHVCHTNTMCSSGVDVDTEVGTGSYSTSVSAFNQTTFVVGYYDYSATDKNVSLKVCDRYGTCTVEITGDANPGNSFTSSVVVLNSTGYFVQGYYNQISGNMSVALYDNTNTKYAVKTSSITGARYSSVASQLSWLNIGLCDDNFVHAYPVGATKGNWTIYNISGEVSNGLCIITSIIDIANVDSCRDLTTPNMEYNITADLSSVGTCIYVKGNNITVNGYNHIINFSTANSGATLTAGVDVYGVNNTQINNLTIITTDTSGDTSLGIWVDSTIAVPYNTIVDNVNVSGSKIDVGLDVEGNNHVFTNCKVGNMQQNDMVVYNGRNITFTNIYSVGNIQLQKFGFTPAYNITLINYSSTDLNLVYANYGGDVAQNITIINSTLNGDFILDAGNTFDILNSSYTNENINGGILARKWYLTLSTTSGALINVSNRTNSIVYSSVLTDVATTTVTSYTNKSGVTLYQNPFNITATKEGYYQNSTIINITYSRTVELFLAALANCVPPAINNDWNVDFADKCQLLTNLNLGTGSLNLYGSNGYFDLSAELTTRRVTMTCSTSPCQVKVNSGGKLKLN